MRRSRSLGPMHGNPIRTLPSELARCLFVAVAMVVPVLSPAADCREPVECTVELARASLDPALMCLAIYRNCQVFGWQGPIQQIGARSLVDDTTGLDAGIYERTTPQGRKVVLCYRGSDTLQDWKTDFAQAMGETPEQYRQAIVFAKMAMIYAGETGNGVPGHLSFTGHSLGGGLAEFSALAVGRPAVAFASAPLGSGVQRILTDARGAGALRDAPRFVTHFFIRGDLVPQSAAVAGAHFGKIVKPELEVPSNLSGASQEERKTDAPAYRKLLAVAGLNLKDRGLPVKFARKAVDAVARHRMENYLAALAAKLPSDVNGLAMPGAWKSQGSFFQLTNNTTRLFFTANGRVVFSNELEILGDRFRLADTGEWKCDGHSLTLCLGGLADLGYELAATAPGQVVQWRRTSLEPKVDGLQAALEHAGRHDAKATAILTASLLKGAFQAIKNTTVTWQRDPDATFPNLP